MASHVSPPVRIAVLGLGHVGATFAYALLLSGMASEIVMIDANHAKAEGEAMDLGHAVPFTRPARIWAGGYEDCAGAAVTVLAAGAAQKPGETRLDLLKKNAALFRDIVPRVVQYNPDGILLVATNPVDVLSYAAWKLAGLPAAKVIGSGTILDTARFRYLLGRHFGVDPRSIHAFIIGEHGDSEVPVWSLANVVGIPVADLRTTEGGAFDAAARESLFAQTRDAAYGIIERKGSTYYAVAAGLLRIVEAILRNQNTVLSVSTLISGYGGIRDVFLSLPTVVGRAGVRQVLQPALSDEEAAALQHSAAVLRAAVEELRLG
jgi:L-lactate dehydrogenase